MPAVRFSVAENRTGIRADPPAGDRLHPEDLVIGPGRRVCQAVQLRWLTRIDVCQFDELSKVIP
jgi:hypothetical protein